MKHLIFCQLRSISLFFASIRRNGRTRKRQAGWLGEEPDRDTGSLVRGS